MKRMIALLLLLCMLTACAAPVPETEEPPAEMTVTLPDGTALTEAASPAETAALERAEAFNSRFRDWAGADGFDEVTAWAEEELAFRTESGGNWTPYTLELDCSV